MKRIEWQRENYRASKNGREISKKTKRGVERERESC